MYTVEKIVLLLYVYGKFCVEIRQFVLRSSWQVSRVLLQDIDRLMEQFQLRLTGENGTASGIINTMNSMEMWHIKFAAFLHGNNPIPDQDWLRSASLCQPRAVTSQCCLQVVHDVILFFYRLYATLDDWSVYLKNTIGSIASTQKENWKIIVER